MKNVVYKTDECGTGLQLGLSIYNLKTRQYEGVEQNLSRTSSIPCRMIVSGEELNGDLFERYRVGFD
jgi:hypothetical protein